MIGGIGGCGIQRPSCRFHPIDGSIVAKVGRRNALNAHDDDLFKKQLQ